MYAPLSSGVSWHHTVDCPPPPPPLVRLCSIRGADLAIERCVILLCWRGERETTRENRHLKCHNLKGQMRLIPAKSRQRSGRDLCGHLNFVWSGPLTLFFLFPFMVISDNHAASDSEHVCAGEVF